jgi:hypothetical protein
LFSREGFRDKAFFYFPVSTFVFKVTCLHAVVHFGTQAWNGRHCHTVGCRAS